MALKLPAEPKSRSKIALLFLIRAKLNLEGRWRTWMRCHEHRVSIHVHSTGRPGSEWLRDHLLPERFETRWGFIMEAQRALLEQALHDPMSQRFVFLSESCVPLRPFDETIRRLNRFDGSLVPHRAEAMKGHQLRIRRPSSWNFAWFWSQDTWIALNRAHAELLTNDKEVFPQFLDRFAGDEHYPINFLRSRGLGHEVVNATVTAARWCTNASHPETLGPTLNVTDQQWLEESVSSEAVFARKFASGCEEQLGKLLPA